MPRSSSMFFATALSTALWFVAGKAAADEACVPTKVSEAVTSCAGVASLPVMTAAQLLAAFEARGKPGALTGNLPRAGKARASRPRGERYLPRPFDDAEQQLDGAFRRFLCEDKPTTADAKGQELHGEVANAWARIHFQANHFEEAAVLFRDLAIHRAAEPIGVFAQMHYLESLNVLGSAIEPPRPACYDDMERDVPTLITLYCRDGKDKVNEEPCDVVRRIHRDILQLDAERWVKKGDADASESAYASAAGIYLRVWNEYGQKPCEARQPECARMDEILYNAARAYQAAHLVDKAIATRKTLLDPRYNLHLTELARRTRYELGVTYQSIAAYDEAASWYEAFAGASPSHDRAHEALLDATVLRLGLHQLDQAERDAGLFNKNYGSARPARTAQVVFAVAAHVSEQGDHAGARKRLRASMGQIDKNATREVQIRAHALLGREQVALRDRAEARVEYGKVRALVRAYLLAGATGDDDEQARDRALAAVLTADGEAAFFFAEEKRLALEIVGAPTFAGAGKADELRDFVQVKLGAWAAQRRAAVDEVEKAYLEVLAIQPMAPPKWVVAAAARVAQMRGKLAAEIRATPAPKGWKAQGTSPWGKDWAEVRAGWMEALDQACAPDEARAMAAHQRCVALSAKLQVGADEARVCAAWLSRHEPRRYPRLDEIIDRPTRVGSGLESRPVTAP